MDSFDIVIVGSGPGGYAAAVHAAGRGATVALIEEKQAGGTCLNTGCIPTKALLASAKMLHEIRSKAQALGVTVPSATLEHTKVFARKDRVVARLVKGLLSLFQHKKVTFIQGRARYQGGHTVTVGDQEIGFKKLIWASGSQPKVLSSVPFGPRVLSSTELLNIKTRPESLIVIGGGVIGVEMATYWAIAGTAVTVIEMCPEILPGVDSEAARLVRTSLERKGVTIITGVTVSSCIERATDVEVTSSEGKKVHAEYVLNAVGRSCDLSAIEGSGIKTTSRGAIQVNEELETTVPDIYAIGDVTGITWLAHGASYQGIIAAENALGGNRRADYHAVPSCIFSLPEIAMVGTCTVIEGITVTKVPLNVLGKMQADQETDGFIKIFIEKASDMVKGVCIVGPHASDLLSEGTLSVHLGLTTKQLQEVIRPHPTLSEIYTEAFWPTHV